MVTPGPEVSGSHLQVSAQMVEGLLGFRAGNSKTEVHCDIPNPSTNKC